jgi:hypothetical protein
MITPIRTAEKDANYLSYNVDSIIWFAGTDRETPAEPGAPMNDLVPTDPKAWDAILKLSGRTYTDLPNLRVAQGKEAAVDCNNTTCYCCLEGRFGVAGNEGEYVFKIKGGSHELTLKGEVESTGTKADVSLGEWSDQSSAPVHSLDLSHLSHVSDRPLTIILGRVNSPIRTILTGCSPDIAFPANSRILKLRSLGELIHWWLKRLWVAAWYCKW